MKIEPGQMAFAWRTIGERLYPDPDMRPAINTLRSRLKRLESVGKITVQKAVAPTTQKPIATLLSIQNWSRFQGDLSVSTVNTHLDTHPDTHLDTDRRRERRKKKRGAFAPPTREDVRGYCKEQNLAVDPDYFFDFFTVGDWIDTNGKPVHNWKQKLLTWNRDEKRKPALQVHRPENRLFEGQTA
ncbi:MAG: hypothetical protein NXI32_26825 [bacterium]|nr:hypothetical protein [bacterium]